MPFLIIAVLIIIAYVFYKSPRGKGIIVELRVKFDLGKKIKGKKYIINNITLVDDVSSGKNGDQQLTRRNREIVESAAIGKILYLYIKFGHTEYYPQGIIETS